MESQITIDENIVQYIIKAFKTSTSELPNSQVGEHLNG